MTSKLGSIGFRRVPLWPLSRFVVPAVGDTTEVYFFFNLLHFCYDTQHHPPSPTIFRLRTSESEVAAVVSEWSEKSWLLDELSEDGRKQLLKDLQQALRKCPTDPSQAFRK